MAPDIKHFFEFGDFRFDPEKKTLWRSGEMVALAPKAAEVLVHLVKSRGDLVEREQLFESVWRGTFVEEGNLNHAISALRRVLADEGVIQTIPRRGYRFLADVREVHDGEAPNVYIERRTISNTVIEEREEFEGPAGSSSNELVLAKRFTRPIAAVIGVVILLVAAAGAWVWNRDPLERAVAGRSSIKSLAVLPLRSFSGSGSDEELRLRITDALITRLGAFNNVAVRPTNSVLKFATDTLDSQEAGKQLGVDAVLDGRVQTEGARLRVTLQLISVSNGDQLWAEQFDGRPGEILALQDSILSKLRTDLFLTERNTDKPTPPINNEAYEAYLKGRYLWNQRRRESYSKALEYFEQAVKIDPGFALGYTGISDTYHMLQQRNAISTTDAFAMGEPAARKALELDPDLPEANVSMGSVSFIRYSRWVEAESYYRRAIELNPQSPEPYARLGMLLNAWERYDEAHTVLKKAEELDPTSVNNAIYLGANYYFSKQWERAIEQFNRIGEFAPETERVHFFLARIFEVNGRFDEAVEHTLLERSVFRPDSVETLRSVYQLSGIRAFWLKQAELLIDESRNQYGLENHIASRYVLLGDLKTACHYVEKNLAVFGSMQNYGRVDPIFDPLLSNSECSHLIQNAAAPQ